MKSTIILFNYILIQWLQTLHANAVTYASCNDKESCISLIECPMLGQRVLESVDQNYKERDFLRSKQCGFENGQVLVCCDLGTASRSAIGNIGNARRNPLSVNTNNLSTGRGTQIPAAPECGPVLADRIFGGRIAHIYEFPWMAMLEYTKPGNQKKFHCGGSLINHRYVLTAAHCVLVSNMELTGVRLGEWDVNMDPDCEVDQWGRQDCAKLKPIDLGIESTVVHDNYEQNSLTPSHDIALIRLSQEVEFNDQVRPICLPKPALRNEHFVGFKMDVSGWGLTEQKEESPVKLKAEVPIWNLGECRRKYVNISIIDSQLCAGGEQGIDSCRGDSGGPLMTIYDNSYILAGIVSHGPLACGTRGLPGVYTRVAAFSDWIVMALRP